MRILVSGLGGQMGREVAKLALAGYRGAELAGGVSRSGCEDFGVPCVREFSSASAADVDLVVDFSNHELTGPLLDFCLAHGLPLVIGTTGQTEGERRAIEAASARIPIFFAANYSMGVALLIELAKKTAEIMHDAEIEIVEMHHDRKADAPSGTALAIARAIQEVRPEATLNLGRSGMGKRTKEEIGISAIRMGNVIGVHEVMIGTPTQTITLKHEVHSRALFAEGALAAAEFLLDRRPGLYDMHAMVRL